jgi:hypothetical protein
MRDSDRQPRPQVTRQQAAADASGSVRAEGLDPGRAEPVLVAWARGEVTDEQLAEVSRLMLKNLDLTAFELIAAVKTSDS